MAENRIPLTIAGLSLVITTGEDEEYVRSIAEEIDADITGILERNPSASVTSAGLLCALDYLDNSKKATKNANSLRSQIKDYLADAANAKLMYDEERRRSGELDVELQALRSHLTRLASEADTTGVVERLKSELAASTTELARLRKQTADALAQNKALAEKAGAMSDYISGQDREIERLQMQAADNGSKLAAAAEQIERLSRGDSSARELSAQNDRLAAENERLAADNAELRRQLDTLTEAIRDGSLVAVEDAVLPDAAPSAPEHSEPVVPMTLEEPPVDADQFPNATPVEFVPEPVQPTPPQDTAPAGDPADSAPAAPESPAAPQPAPYKPSSWWDAPKAAPSPDDIPIDELTPADEPDGDRGANTAPFEDVPAGDIPAAPQPAPYKPASWWDAPKATPSPDDIPIDELTPADEPDGDRGANTAPFEDVPVGDIPAAPVPEEEPSDERDLPGQITLFDDPIPDTDDGPAPETKDADAAPSPAESDDPFSDLKIESGDLTLGFEGSASSMDVPLEDITRASRRGDELPAEDVAQQGDLAAADPDYVFEDNIMDILDSRPTLTEADVPGLFDDGATRERKPSPAAPALEAAPAEAPEAQAAPAAAPDTAGSGTPALFADTAFSEALAPREEDSKPGLFGGLFGRRREKKDAPPVVDELIFDDDSPDLLLRAPVDLEDIIESLDDEDDMPNLSWIEDIE